MSRGAFTAAQRQAIYEREGRCCAACGRHAEGGSIQHRLARGMGGTRRKVTLAHGILLCGSATTGDHGYLEAHPDVALRYGFRVSQGQDPADCPVRVHGVGWVRLSPNGAYVPCEAPVVTPLCVVCGSVCPDPGLWVVRGGEACSEHCARRAAGSLFDDHPDQPGRCDVLDNNGYCQAAPDLLISTPCPRCGWHVAQVCSAHALRVAVRVDGAQVLR